MQFWPMAGSYGCYRNQEIYTIRYAEGSVSEWRMAKSPHKLQWASFLSEQPEVAFHHISLPGVWQHKLQLLYIARKPVEN